jgi:glyoxylase-like metal-dependent hydrolase (beta-lactamase superfamily II)
MKEHVKKRMKEDAFRLLKPQICSGFMVTKINRRDLLARSLALGAGLFTAPGFAAMPQAGKQAPEFYRYKVGGFELTAVSDGVWQRPIDDKFVRNAFFPDVQKAMSEAFLPTHILPTPFTALVVNTGKKLVLIDTGSGGQITRTAGTLVANLAAAGIEPKSIDTILISNFHPDHINGIKTKNDELVFPNAEINVPAPEWAFWMDDGKLSRAKDTLKGYFLNSRRIFSDIAKTVKRFEPRKEIVPGITSVPAFGHTPGHTAYIVSDGNQSLFVLCDVTNHPALFARHPEWQAVVDQDGPLAVETRKRILDRVAADRMLIQGYHFPFPGTGHIAKVAGGYDFVPSLWQNIL